MQWVEPATHVDPTYDDGVLAARLEHDDCVSGGGLGDVGEGGEVVPA